MRLQPDPFPTVVLTPHRPSSVAAVLAPLDRAAELGCDVECDALAAARGLAVRQHDIDRAAADLRAAGGSAAIDGLGRRFHAGDLDLEGLAAAGVAAAVAADRDGPVQLALDTARLLVTADAVHTLRAAGDRLVTDVLRPRVDALLDDLRVHAAAIPTTVSAAYDKRLTHDRDIREAWGRAHDTIVVLGEAHRCADQLRINGCIPAQPCDSGRYRWRRPDLLTGHPGWPQRFLLDNLDSGAQPGIWTEAEVAETEADRAA